MFFVSNAAKRGYCQKTKYAKYAKGHLKLGIKFLERLFAGKVGDIEVLQAEASVGDIFQQWLKSDIGRYIVGRAEQQELTTLRRLREADPRDAVLVTKLQAESKIHGNLLQWISEAIVQGENAKFQLDEIEDDLER